MENLIQFIQTIDPSLLSGILLVLLAVIGIFFVLLFQQYQQLKQGSLENKESLANLRRERERAQRYLDTTQTLMVALDHDGNITMVNRASCDLLGYVEDELLGRNWFATCLPQPKGLETIYPVFSRIMAGETQSTEYFENPVLCRDGSQRFIAWYNANIIDEAGKITGSLSSGQDITERKQVEKALGKSEAIRNAILKTIPDLIWLKDPDGVYLACNTAFEQFFGAKETEIVSKTDHDFVDQELAGIFRTNDQAAITARGPRSNEEWVTFANDGHRALLLTTKTPMYDQSGELIGVLGVARDITERKRAEEALSLNQESLKEAQRIAHIGNWNLDLVSNVLTWSDEIYRIFEIDPHGFDASYEAFLDAVHPDDREFVNQAYTDSVKTRIPYDIVHRLQMKDGRIKYVNERCETYYDIQGIPQRSVGTVQDISEQKQLEKELKLAASVFTHAREGITITDPKGLIIAVNDAFTQITGYSRDEAVGQNPRVLKSGRHGEEFYTDMWNDLAKIGQWSGEIWNRRKNGEIYPELLTISAVNDNQGQIQHYVALFSDITAQKRYQDQLERVAHYDALTSLPNRVLLADRMHQAMAQAKRRALHLAVVYLDLDGFKEINDSYGHEVGDQLLMSLATRMKQVLREGDTIARLGGDEFVAVLIDLADVKDCLPMLTRLLTSSAQPVHISDRILKVSASLGVTFYHHDEEEDVGADQLLRQADQAMYQAKLTGKNRYHFFDTEQDKNTRGHHEKLENIGRALNERDFVLYYQPLVNMRSGELVGVEALIRWQHRKRGLLLPDTFLPAVVDHKLDIEIGEWVIDTALSQAEEWRDAGFDLVMSVNVSAYQLQQADFVDRLSRILANYPKVEPDHLQLEVLETSALEDITHVSKVIHACKEIGVSFALDDFGTGYSSLTYLKRLPSARLKIDRSFVRDMLVDPDDLAILDGILGLATAFRRDAIAEGVESMEQAEMLLQLGCELAQGYAIARPMPAADIPKWASTWRPEPTWSNQRLVNRDGLPLLFAGVEHRAWVWAVEDYLLGNRTVPPPLDDHQCNFSQWLNGEGQERYAGQPAMHEISVLHRQIHHFARDLVGLQTKGQKTEAVARLSELHSLRNDLLALLKSIAGHEA